jgi:hypothetical protein
MMAHPLIQVTTVAKKIPTTTTLTKETATKTAAPATFGGPLLTPMETLSTAE